MDFEEAKPSSHLINPDIETTDRLGHEHRHSGDESFEL
jgi:hypothetical protein